MDYGKIKEQPVPVSRIIDKLDSYLGRNDYESAQRHLKYWEMEAFNSGDERGRLSILNEQMGLYRKLQKKEDAFSALDKALELIKKLGLEESVSGATSFLNAATVCKAFSFSERALSLYRRAEKIYTNNLDSEDSRLGGLYNNMALALVDLECFSEAESYYMKAINIMSKVKNGELEMAITWLNLANAKESELGLESACVLIEEYLDRAQILLETDGIPHDGYYAFVCEKCAPTFRYYGRFLFSKHLEEISRSIYERT